MKGNPVDFYYELLREAVQSGLWPDNLAMLRRIRDSDDLFILPDVHKIDGVALHFQRLMEQLGRVTERNHPGEHLESRFREELDRLIAELDTRGEATDSRRDAADLMGDLPIIRIVERSGTNWESPEQVIEELPRTERVTFLGLICRDASDGRGALGWARDWRMAVAEMGPGRDFYEPNLVVIGTGFDSRTTRGLRCEDVLVVEVASEDDLDDPAGAVRQWLVQARRQFLGARARPFTDLNPIFAGPIESELSPEEGSPGPADAAVNPVYGKFPAHADPELFYGPYIDWLRRGTSSDD